MFKTRSTKWFRPLDSKKTKNKIELRPHHLMCVHGFRGKGYSPEYVANFWKIFDRLKSDDSEFVEVIQGPDDICRPCPNNFEGKCTPSGIIDEPRIRSLDDAFQKSLSVQIGEKISWNEVKTRIVENISDEVFEKNCAPCAWKKLGYCKEALEDLRKTLK